MKKIFFLILFFSSFLFSRVFAAQTDNVSGWAFSDNIGWISFNSLNDGTLTDYGVKVSATTGKFSGYAWSENIGWISFNRSDTGAPPSDDPCPDGSCTAKLETTMNVGASNVKILGWARALSVCPSLPCHSGDMNGGWDGWIRFDHGKSNEAYIDAQGNFHGYAWSDNPTAGPLGWISLNCEEGGANAQSLCSISNYKVSLDISEFLKPQVGTTSEDLEPCAWNTFPQVNSGLAVRLNWNYLSLQGSPQGGYEIWLDNDPNFSDPKFNYIATSSASSYLLNLQDDRNQDWFSTLSFNTTYYWKVRVKDSRGNWSDWSATDSFQTPPHPYPHPLFTWSPKEAYVNREIQFCSVSKDNCARIISADADSECFAPPCRFNWTFDNANPSYSDLENPTTTFQTALVNTTVTLKITDSDGFSCSTTTTFHTNPPPPNWDLRGETFLPVRWLERLLASLRGMFQLIKTYLTNPFGSIKVKIIT